MMEDWVYSIVEDGTYRFILENILRNKINNGKTSFNLAISENNSKYKIIEVPQPGVITEGKRKVK